MLDFLKKKKMADQCKKETASLHDRGLHDQTFFHVVFEDGSDRKEHDLNWSEISVEQVVNHFGHQKIARVSNVPVKSVTISHNGMTATLSPKKGEKIYQAVRSITSFKADGTPVNFVIGRVVGRVKDGEVVEELFIDGRTNETFGLRT